MKNSISLKKGTDFHGHLGPWLVLGIILGDYILKKLSACKYFGLKIRVYGLNKKPKTCLLDGLQLTTGCTLGKSNLLTYKAKSIKINCLNTKTKKKLTLRFRKELLHLLSSLKDNRTSEKIAKELYRIDPKQLLK